jgi:hypothetical protein
VRNDALATQKGNEMPSTDTQASVNPNDVLTQLVTGPSIREVATNVLRPALKKLYPDLKTDPAHMMVVTPRWMIVDDQVQPGPLRFEALTDVLVRLAISETTVTYIEGEHFLSLAPGVDELIHLPVRIDAIGHLLNEQASVLLHAGRSCRRHCGNYGMSTGWKTGTRISWQSRVRYSTIPTQQNDTARISTRREPA